MLIVGLIFLEVAIASRVIFPPLNSPEFNTPAMTNGFCRSPPLRFTISGNISVPKNAGCTAFEAKDLIVIVPNGACSLSQTMEYSIQSGAKAVIYHYFEIHTVGRVSRVPFADYIVKIPIVMVRTASD
jgi:hypothetical protein